MFAPYCELTLVTFVTNCRSNVIFIQKYFTSLTSNHCRHFVTRILDGLADVGEE